MAQFGNGDFYEQDIDGLDISKYDDKMSELYERIKSAEFTGAEYGKGLFLVSNKEAENNYLQALKSAAAHPRSFGTSNYYAWLGTYYGSYYAYCVNSESNADYDGQDYSYVIAPAFNLDVSKIRIDGDEIVII